VIAAAKIPSVRAANRSTIATLRAAGPDMPDDGSLRLKAAAWFLRANGDAPSASAGGPTGIASALVPPVLAHHWSRRTTSALVVGAANDGSESGGVRSLPPAGV
jgi:hypothetical protein